MNEQNLLTPWQLIYIWQQTAQFNVPKFQGDYLHVPVMCLTLFPNSLPLICTIDWLLGLSLNVSVYKASLEILGEVF